MNPFQIKSLGLIKRTFLFFFLILLTSLSFSQTILLEVTNLESNKGQIIVAIFQDDQTFQDEVPNTISAFLKRPLKTEKCISNSHFHQVLMVLH